MNKMFNGISAIILGMGMFLGGQANAALIGIGASAPDMQFLSSTVNYNSGTDLLTIVNTATVGLPGGASKWKDASGNVFEQNPGVFDGANPNNFSESMTLTATIDALGQLVAGGVNNIVLNGIMAFDVYTIGTSGDAASAENILVADLNQVGFDASSGALDFLATVASGNTQITSLFGTVGVIANGAGFNGWDSDFFSTTSGVDVTTPAPTTSVPVPAGMFLMLFGLTLLKRKVSISA